MINFCHHYVPDYSTFSTPLLLLSKKDKYFEWTNEQKTAFQQLKETLSNAPVMAFYDAQANTSITIDVSPTRLGAILSQLQSNGTTKPIS